MNSTFMQMFHVFPLIAERSCVAADLPPALSAVEKKLSFLRPSEHVVCYLHYQLQVLNDLFFYNVVTYLFNFSVNYI